MRVFQLVGIHSLTNYNKTYRKGIQIVIFKANLIDNESVYVNLFLNSKINS